METQTSAPMRQRVAEEVRVALARRRLSASELARRMGVTQRYISRRLTAEIAFDVDDLQRIARALGVAVADLLPADAHQPHTGLRTVDGVTTMSRDRTNIYYSQRPTRTTRPVRMEPVKKARSGQGPPGRPTTTIQTLSRPAGRTGQAVRRAQRISTPHADAA